MRRFYAEAADDDADKDPAEGGEDADKRVSQANAGLLVLREAGIAYGV